MAAKTGKKSDKKDKARKKNDGEKAGSTAFFLDLAVIWP